MAWLRNLLQRQFIIKYYRHKPDDEAVAEQNTDFKDDENISIGSDQVMMVVKQLLKTPFQVPTDNKICFKKKNTLQLL